MATLQHDKKSRKGQKFQISTWTSLAKWATSNFHSDLNRTVPTPDLDRSFFEICPEMHALAKMAYFGETGRIGEQSQNC